MAETTADVRRDIEITRDRISNTLSQLEQKVNVTQVIKDHPWPALGLALGAGYLLSGSKVDVKAAATTVAATKGASSRLGTVLDDLVANLMGGLSAAFEDRVESLVSELKGAIGAPTPGGARRSTGAANGFMSTGNTGGMMASSSNAGSNSTGASSGSPSAFGAPGASGASSGGMSAGASPASSGFGAAGGSDNPSSY